MSSVALGSSILIDVQNQTASSSSYYLLLESWGDAEECISYNVMLKPGLRSACYALPVVLFLPLHSV